MGWILVIESNDLSLKQINEAFAQIEPNLKLNHFNDLGRFRDWLVLLKKNDPNAILQIPASPFLGIIADVATLSSKDLQPENFRSLFIEHGFATVEQQIFVILTGYDTPLLNRKRYEKSFANNFLYKPFDKLLLKQILEIAMAGRAPVSKYHIHRIKAELPIEMLKDLRISELSETGFQLAAKQDLKSGEVGKYIAEIFKSPLHQSILAKVEVEASQPLSEKVHLSFFGVDQNQCLNIQKLIHGRVHTRVSKGGNGDAKDDQKVYEFIFLEGDNLELCQQLKASLERVFKCNTVVFKNLQEVLTHLDENKSAASQKMLFLDAQHFSGSEVTGSQSIKLAKKEMNLSIYLLSAAVFPVTLEIELSAVCEDIYYFPYNRPYILKAFSRKWKDLKPTEDVSELATEIDQIIQYSQTVNLIEASEANVVIEFPTEIPVGSFLNFIFAMPHSSESSRPLLGQCNFIEFVKETKVFNCHFVFFGLQDGQQKHIRLWMLQNYIESKPKN